MSTQLPSEESPLLDASDCDTDDDAHPLSLGTALRISAAMYSFAIMGLFQSSVGVMLDPLSQHYSLSDLHVSFIFIVGPVGYVIAAQFNDLVHCTWGQRGIAVIAPTLQTLGAIGIAARPPFSVVLVAFAAVALGSGLLDGSWCTWAASGRNANTVFGLLQGSFSVGAAIGPFLAGTVMPAWNKSWYHWYYFLVVASAVDLCVLSFAFRHKDAREYRNETLAKASSKGGKADTKAIFGYLSTWLCALYFLAYVGSETAVSGWVVPFMARHRNASPELASMASSGFWGGMAAGRFTLGIVTDKLGVRRANIIYFIMTIAFQVAFTLVHERIASIVFMTLVGFFMGPMFPSGVVILTRLLPADLHIAAVSFTASAGQIGAALLPFGIGALIQGLGIGIFGSAMIILSSLALLSWIEVSRHRQTISSLSHKDHEDEDSNESLVQ